MGGNALKKVITTRKNKFEYEKIKSIILEKTSKYLKCENVIELPNKESFGDLDILYISDDKINTKDLVIELFNPGEIVVNGDIMSFDYDKFQIDLIKCHSQEDLDSSRFYFSYGDLGAILGRIVNYYGIKFGHEGLWINLIDNTINSDSDINMTKIIGKLELTKSPKNVCEFLSLDYNKWVDKFSSKKEIFDWILTSKYFKKEIFFNLNYDHRRRLSLRPFYKEFLDYIEVSINEITKVNNLDSEIKINLQNHAIEYFDKKKEVLILLENIKLIEERRNKFNGKLLLEIGIKDKELGKIIMEFKIFIKNKFNKTFEEFLDENSKEDIFKIFNNYFYQL